MQVVSKNETKIPQNYLKEKKDKDDKTIQKTKGKTTIYKNIND